MLHLPVHCLKANNDNNKPGGCLSKRKLTKKQHARIAQRRHVEQAAIADQELGEEQEGLVLTHLRNQAEVRGSAGGERVKCHLRANLGPIVAGDRVLWQPGLKWGVVNAVFPRNSEISRPDSYGKLKLIAANVEQMLITIAPEPACHANLIDRYLILAASFGVKPIIVLNKKDLLKDPSPSAQLLELYEELGFTTLRVCAKRAASLAELKALLQDRISVFVGQSGVGKSSIMQQLLPQESLKIGALSEQVKKGRHTTTHARLYHFDFGGQCIDSPGIRELGLWHLNEDQVMLGFPEFSNFVQRCQFRDCSHRNEPGCALIEAVENRHVSRARFDSYQAILNALNDVEVKPR